MISCVVIPKCCVPFYSYSAEMAPPVVTNGVVNVVSGAFFTYQITATNNPLSYSAANLPSGVTVNTVTGIISGTVTAGSSEQIIADIYATNPGGTGAGMLTINVTVLVYVAVVFGSVMSAPGHAPDALETTVAIDGGAPFTPTPGTSYKITDSIAIAASMVVSGYGCYGTFQDFSISSVNGGMITFNTGHCSMIESHTTSSSDASVYIANYNYTGTNSSSITNTPNSDPYSFGMGYVVQLAGAGTTSVAANLPSAMTIDGTHAFNGAIVAGFQYGTTNENFAGTFTLSV
jgi:hypothetical protein